MHPSIRPAIKNLTAYSPGKPIADVKRELGLERVVKLASNENPLGPSPMAVEALRRAIDDAHIYPDGAQFDFRSAAAAKFGMPFDQIVVGNGSDELIHLLGITFLDKPEDEIIVGHPSFVRYDAAAPLAGSKLIQVPLDASYRHDLNAMAEAVTANTKLLFIANPNNPTGTVVLRKELDLLFERLPGHVTVVLDEAYFEFARELPDFPDSIEYVRRGFNVIGLRTFSKAYGLAGIRLGYGFASAEIADAINRAREPFNVNSLAQAAGVAALEDEAHVANTLVNNRLGVQRISAILSSLGAIPCESFANFVFADFGRPTRPIYDQLLKKGVIVRPGDVLGAPNCLRVSVGTPDEIDVFETALRSVMQHLVPA